MARIDFANCAKLTGVAIPDALTEILGNAFMGCTNPVVITLSSTNSRLEMKDGVLIDDEEHRLI